MVLSFLPPPCPLSLFSTSSSSDTFPFGCTQAFPTRRASAPTRERRYGATISAFLLLPGEPCVIFSDHSFLFSSAPSARRAPSMTRPQKRLCKSPEVLNTRSRVLISNSIVNSSSKQSFHSNCKVLAFTSHGSSELAVAELERHAENPLQVQHTHGNAEKSGPRRLKSAEELHFEAIQDYHLRYENEDCYCYEKDDAYDVVRPDASSPEPPRSQMHVRAPVVGRDEAKTPVNESKYVSLRESFSPWHDDQDASQSLASGLEAGSPRNSNLEKRTALDDVAQSIRSGEAPQFPLQADGKSAGRRRSKQISTVNVGSCGSSARRPPQSPQSKSVQNSTITASKSKTVGTSDVDPSQNQCKSDIEEDIQHESSSANGEGMQTEEEKSNSEVNRALNEEQRVRMELNKAAALARRNMRRCEEVVLEAQAKGLSFPKFESLLVDRSWMEVLAIEFQKPYMERLHQFVSQEAAGRIPIYPPPAKLFNAFNSCPFDRVKVVIIGQDPYHGPGQAMGLCFSVEKGVKLPSSLSNIFLEIESDLHCDFPLHGNLEKWAHQGVLLLNTVLTVRDHHANSHAKKGWELFTDAAIRALAQKRSGLVFLLWGNQAQEKLRLINKTSHHVLKAFHPSGISAHKGFFKCRHFSKTNQLLVDQGSLPIDWQL